jgi:hypothetical protein
VTATRRALIAIRDRVCAPHLKREFIAGDLEHHHVGEYEIEPSSVGLSRESIGGARGDRLC